MAPIEGVGSQVEAGDIARMVGFLQEHQRVAAEMERLRGRVQSSPAASMGAVPLSQLGRSLDVRA